MLAMYSCQNNSNIESAIRECFSTDKPLLERWHIAAPGTLDECVHRTMHDVETFDPSFKFYKVYEGECLAGYWGTEYGRHINLIFVKPEYRISSFMSKFWAAVKASVQPKFQTAVYARNIPAVEFYSPRSTAKYLEKYNGEDIVIFTFEKEKV